MEQTSSLEKQIQTSYEAMKSEIIVPQSDLESKESVKKIIKKYQNRVSEMLKLIQKQKKHNETLKTEFKQLNEQLNNVLRKVQAKGRPEEDQKSTENKADLIKKELENEIKKNSILKKEIDQLKYKYSYLSGDKVDVLKNELKDKDRCIEELNAQIKLFQKLDKQEKNGDSYKKQEQLTQKILQQNEEIVHLKKKLQEIKKNEEATEKTIKNLRQQIGVLEGKPAKTPAPTTDSKVQIKPKQKVEPSFSQEDYLKLNQKFKQLENAKKMNDKTSKHEIDTLTLKLKNCERELHQMKEQVGKKEKESNILMFKLKEKERKNYNTLQPINKIRYSEEILHSSNLFETRKQFKGLNYGQGIYRDFDDSKGLPIEKNYRIKKIVMTHFQEHILSLTTDYEIIEGDSSAKDAKKTVKTIQSFTIPSQYANIKTVEYNFTDYEYIAGIELFCNKSIEYIKIETSKQQIIEIGNSKNIPKCKSYSFDIKHHEKPIAFTGIIENKKVNGDGKEYLINLGLQIRRKQVFLRSKFNRKSQSLYRKSTISKSNNDKNIKKEE